MQTLTTDKPRRRDEGSGDRDRRRLSLRTLIAICACLAIVGGAGTAAAGGLLSGKEKKQVRKIAKKEINKGAGGLTVARAEQAGSAERAERATKADSATQAGVANRAKVATSADKATTATAVNGIEIEPVSIAMKDGDPAEYPLDVGGSQVELSCAGGGLQLLIRRGSLPDSPPIVAHVGSPGGGSTLAPNPGNGLSAGSQPNGAVSASIREASGRVTRLELEAFYKADVYGGPEDCFAQGTVERFG